jgi:hypothetical protein
MGTRRIAKLELSLVLSREQGPPAADTEIHQALLGKLTSGIVRVDERTAYRITSIMYSEPS